MTNLRFRVMDVTQVLPARNIRLVIKSWALNSCYMLLPRKHFPECLCSQDVTRRRLWLGGIFISFLFFMEMILYFVNFTDNEWWLILINPGWGIGFLAWGERNTGVGGSGWMERNVSDSSWIWIPYEVPPGAQESLGSGKWKGPSMKFLRDSQCNLPEWWWLTPFLW